MLSFSEFLLESNEITKLCQEDELLSTAISNGLTAKGFRVINIVPFEEIGAGAVRVFFTDKNGYFDGNGTFVQFDSVEYIIKTEKDVLNVKFKFKDRRHEFGQYAQVGTGVLTNEKEMKEKGEIRQAIFSELKKNGYGVELDVADPMNIRVDVRKMTQIDSDANEGVASAVKENTILVCINHGQKFAARRAEFFRVVKRVEGELVLEELESILKNGKLFPGSPTGTNHMKRTILGNSNNETIKFSGDRYHVYAIFDGNGIDFSRAKFDKF